jgi:hypothetical protein
LEKRDNWLGRNYEYANQFILDQDDYAVIAGIERYDEWEKDKNYELRKISFYQAVDA